MPSFIVRHFFIFGGIIVIIVATYINLGGVLHTKYSYSKITPLVNIATSTSNGKFYTNSLMFDTKEYDKKLYEISNNPITYASSTENATNTAITSRYLWPVKTHYPKAGAILPFNRIVAYYGNLYSKQMGVLGQYPEDEMLAKLSVEVKKWQEVDPSTPVIPALHYIAVTAQASPGFDGKYRARMPNSQIDEVLRMADKIHGIVFIDIQVGLSDIQTELPMLEKYLKMPNVHLGIDPEFYMKTGKKPGTVIGSIDATDINYTTNYLSRLVKENNLPPKLFVIHRFTGPMVTNYKNITTLPEVQIIMDMDGWGEKATKLNTYNSFIYKQPIQFTGFKLFYKNDTLKASTTLITPKEILKLRPIPSYIQYQ